MTSTASSVSENNSFLSNTVNAKFISSSIEPEEEEEEQKTINFSPNATNSIDICGFEEELKSTFASPNHLHDNAIDSNLSSQFEESISLQNTNLNVINSENLNNQIYDDTLNENIIKKVIDIKNVNTERKKRGRPKKLTDLVKKKEKIQSKKESLEENCNNGIESVLNLNTEKTVTLNTDITKNLSKKNVSTIVENKKNSKTVLNVKKISTTTSKKVKLSTKNKEKKKKLNLKINNLNHVKKIGFRKKKKNSSPASYNKENLNTSFSSNSSLSSISSLKKRKNSAPKQIKRCKKTAVVTKNSNCSAEKPNQTISIKKNLTKIQHNNNNKTKNLVKNDVQNLENSKLEITKAKDLSQTDFPMPEIPVYEQLEENLILCDDALSRESKAIRCYCTPTDEDLLKNRGCGEDCINRLLFMECGSRCPSGKYCINKRFQKRQYADVEIFVAGQKGWGLRAKSPIAKDQFIIEYVGEVVDVFGMASRMKRYGKDPKHKHHYFMALRNGAVIDATARGNLSRFINHSCDPNAITQKWTVNRQLRVGFFALRAINAGEEIVFNYQFERYGKKAQECYCNSANCTGYIGVNNGDNISENSSSDSSDSEILEDSETEDLSIKQPKKQSIENFQVNNVNPPMEKDFTNKAPKKKTHRNFEHRLRRLESENEKKKAMELVEVSNLLNRGPLRNKEHVLEFNRLMVRVDHSESRQKMVDYLLSIEDPVILRLFVENQGLGLIRIWFVMSDMPEVNKLRMRNSIVKLLLRLPITSKNQIDEASILPTLKHLQKLELCNEIIIQDLLSDIVHKVSCGILDNEIVVKRADSTSFVFTNFQANLQRVLDKWSTLSYFKIPKKIASILRKTEKWCSDSNNDNYAAKFDGFSDMAIDSDDDDQNGKNRFSKNYVPHYKNFNHIGITKISPNMANSGVMSLNQSNNNQRFMIPPIQSSTYYSTSSNSVPPQLTVRPNIFALPPPPLALPPSMAPFPPPMVMFPSPQMLMCNVAAMTQAAVINSQTQRVPPPPPPPPISNKNDKKEEKTSKDWLKSIAEEAASAALTANAKLTDLNKSSKKDVKKRERDEKYGEKSLRKREDNKKIKEKSYKKRKSHSQSRSRSTSLSGSKSPIRRKHDKRRSRSKSQSCDFYSSRRKSLISSYRRNGLFRNERFSSYRRSRSSRRDRYLPYSRRSSRNRKKSEEKNKDRNRKRSKEKDRYLKPEKEKEKMKNLDEKDKKMSELIVDDNLIKNNDSKWKVIGEIAKEEQHFLNFGKPLSPLRENDNNDNKNVEILNEKNLTAKVNCDFDSESDNCSVSSVDQLKKSIRSNVKIKKISPAPTLKPKTQLKININTMRTLPQASLMSPSKQALTINAKMHFSPILMSKETDATNSIKFLNNSKIATLPPPPLPPPELNDTKDVNNEMKKLSNSVEQNTLFYKDVDIKENISQDGNNISVRKEIVEKIEVISKEENNNNNSVKLITTKENLFKKEENKLPVDKPPLPPKLKLEMLASADAIGIYINSLQDYITVIKEYVGLLKNYSVKTFSVEPEENVVQEKIKNKQSTCEDSESKLVKKESVLNNYLKRKPIDNDVEIKPFSFFKARDPRMLSKVLAQSSEISKRIVTNEIEEDDDENLAPTLKRRKVGDTTTPPEDPISSDSCLLLKETNNCNNTFVSSSITTIDNKGMFAVQNKNFSVKGDINDNTSLINEENYVTTLQSENSVNHETLPSTSENFIEESNQLQKDNDLTEVSTSAEQRSPTMEDYNEKNFTSNSNSLSINEYKFENNEKLDENDKKTNCVVEKVISKSGNWMAAKDAEGNIYYFHRVTREAVWELPAHEKIDKLNEKNLLTERNEKRAEFKRQVSEFVGKRMEPYRKRFFSDTSEYVQFLRKITHKVIDNQDKCNNHELRFTDSVRNNTKRLVDEYIRLFKTSSMLNGFIVANTQTNKTDNDSNANFKMKTNFPL